jgi:hypothetical protein
MENSLIYKYARIKDHGYEKGFQLGDLIDGVYEFKKKFKCNVKTIIFGKIEWQEISGYRHTGNDTSWEDGLKVNELRFGSIPSIKVEILDKKYNFELKG